MPILRLTDPTSRVLNELASPPGREWYGLELCKATKLSSGSLYPLLARLEREGWVSSRWEDPARQEAEHRPRRRYYSLTADGLVGFHSLLARRAAAPARLGTSGASA
jgi:PadR family transcriptional regulator, regulatory protein PadR